MKYKGEPFVVSRAYSERNPFGAWTTTLQYTGIQSAILAIARAQGLGHEVAIDTSGAVASVNLRFGNLNNGGAETYTDKWEVDRENLEKDMVFIKPAQALTDAEKLELRRWRADPVNSNLDLTKGPNGVLMGQLKALVLRGADSFQVSTLILKRTRTMSASYAPTIVLTEQTAFYSTAKLITDQLIPKDLSTTLPVTPYTAPTDTQWGWLPRNANRSYIGRGQIEEHTDWVFAAWSTVLYSYVP